MQTFNPLTIPLDGQQLIEASAGTGKTYSIALLYLRLIVEGCLDVDKILVVTFTTSATEELRQRIRSRLREALDVLEAAGDGEIKHNDKVLADLLGSLENRPEAVQRLTDTLVRMDESAVFTIHSFCQRMLQDHAFESGAPFDTEFIESEQQLRREIIQDFWRQRFYPASLAETAWATSIWEDPEGLAKVLSSLMAQSGVAIIPEVSLEEVDSFREASTSCLQAVLHSWTECADEIGDILRDDSCLSRDKKKGYGLERVELALAGMAELASQGETPWLLPDGVELLAASVMAGKLKGKKIAPEHQFFTLFDAFFQNNGEFTRLARIHVIIAAHKFLCTERMIRKRDRAQMYFDDLLVNLDKALAGPAGDGLIQQIQERFIVALVDEFQDTDPLQYRIFHKLFGRAVKNPGLFMIGDPKQSIYSFRGADIFAYIRAKNSTSKSASFTMDTNYRSTSSMVQAVNKLFDHEDSFIFGDDIPFSAVKAGGKADEEPLVIQNASPKPLQVMVLPVEEFAAPKKNSISKELAGIAASQWTAQEIARLLHLAGKGEASIGKRPLTGGDLAVLVRTHREAAMVQRELSSLRIASVYYSQDSVFSSDEALEMHLVLTALLDLSVMPRVNSALATGLFGMDAHDLEQMQSDAAQWDEMIGKLEEYHVRWRDQGVAAMLQKLLSGQKVVQRLIALSGGERKLTNYLHLAELLQDASEHQVGLDGLVRWFGIQRHDPEETSAGQQLRLESDENLVRIVTVHKAKGLEYPVVFLPFAWNGRPVKPNDIFSFHLPESMDHVVDIGTGDQENYLQAERERLAEDLRLLYVAVTRARYCCYFSWGRVSSMDKSAMAWLLHRKKPELAPVFADLTEERIDQDLSRLNDTKKMMEYVSSPHEQEKYSLAREEPEAPLAAKIFHGRIDSGWVISSYSKMARTAAHTSSTGDVQYEPSKPLAEIAGRSVFTFPKGPAAGTCLHTIFEQFDFAEYSSDELQELAEVQLRKTGLDVSWAPLVCRWIADVLKTSLDTDGGLQLQVLGKDDRLVEMGFYFAMKNFDFTRLNQILTNFGLSTVETRAEELTGLMKGYIDLVFCYQGRYFLADYKSNYLGQTPGDYTGSALINAMQEHRYDLQYLIYTVAMHRYLGTRIRGYDYTLHFGGVYYLFLRGMHPDYPPGNGVYYTVPPQELIEQLDACFGTMEEG